MLFKVLFLATVCYITVSHCLDFEQPQRGFTGKVVIQHGPSGIEVTKTVDGLPEYRLVEREVCVLSILQRFDWCPRLCGHTQNSITTSYMGTFLSPANIPDDYAEQFTQIINDMESVGVKHNDIAVRGRGSWDKLEILVLNGRLSLIDFGWASVNGSVPCQLPGGYPAYFKPTEDFLTLIELDHIALMKAKNTAANSSSTYHRDKKRFVGSHTEASSLTRRMNTIQIRGHQNFDLTPNGIVSVTKKMRLRFFKEHLELVHRETASRVVMDMGCGAGELSFIARQVGFDQVYSLDHDMENIRLLSRLVVLKREREHIHPVMLSFGDSLPVNPDVLIVGQLIHWVHTCSENFQGFAPILNYLSVAQWLFIEWFDSKDPSILSFGNVTSCREKSQTEEYSVINFEHAIAKIGEIVFRQKLDVSTRVVYKIKVNKIRHQ